MSGRRKAHAKNRHRADAARIASTADSFTRTVAPIISSGPPEGAIGGSPHNCDMHGATNNGRLTSIRDAAQTSRTRKLRSCLDVYGPLPIASKLWSKGHNC